MFSTQIMDYLALGAYGIAVLFSIRLYFETDKKWYWLFLFLSAIMFGASHALRTLYLMSDINPFPIALIQQFGEIVGSVFFGLACKGMYDDMIEIRKRIE